jgi:hypothetical protein
MALEGKVAYIHVGMGLWSNGHGKHTTRITILLAFRQISDHVNLMSFAIWKLLNCSILTLANAKYINSALSPAALKQAQ